MCATFHDQFCQLLVGKGGKKGGRGREDYLWGQHRIKDEQGSSRDFAKNHYNDDEDDDVELNLKIAFFNIHND